MSFDIQLDSLNTQYLIQVSIEILKVKKIEILKVKKKSINVPSQRSDLQRH